MGRKTHISLEVDKRSLKKLRQLGKRLPNTVMRGMEAGSEAVADSLRAAAPFWRGNLQRSIQVESPKEGVYDIKMLEYGIATDRMRDHYVPLDKGTKIRQWADEHGILSTQQVLFVKHHPWIDASVVNAPDTISQHIQSQLNEVH